MRGALPEYGEAKAGLAKLAVDSVKMREEAQKQYGMLNQLKQQLMEQQQGGGRPAPDPRMIQHMNGLQQQMHRNMRNSQIIQRLREAHFGQQMALYALFSECYESPVINEKRLKGGSQHRVMPVCKLRPFSKEYTKNSLHVIQLHVRYLNKTAMRQH